MDYAVHMRRLPDDCSALALLRRGKLGARALRDIASFAAVFYQHAESRAAEPETMHAHLTENFDQLAPFLGKYADAAQVREIQRLQESWYLDRRSALGARRIAPKGAWA